MTYPSTLILKPQGVFSVVGTKLRKKQVRNQYVAYKGKLCFCLCLVSLSFSGRLSPQDSKDHHPASLVSSMAKKKKKRSLFPNSFNKGLQRDLIGLAWARSHP